MKEKIIVLAIMFLIAGGGFGAVGTNLNVENENNNIFQGDYVPGEVIVGFFSELNEKEPILVNQIESFNGYDIKEKIETLNIAVFSVEEGKEEIFADSISNSPYVSFVEPNYIYHWWLTPNDPKWNQQYGPKRINCEQAWDVTQGISGVKVAIVDTGVDTDHEDISPNYVAGGYDHVNNDNDPEDDQGHGSHCAGIAAGRINNAKGIAGVAGKCQIMAEKVLDSGGSGSSSQVAAGITHAADNGADVISLSLGSSSPSTTIQNACSYAYNDKGVLLVAASGNDYSSSVGYPAAFDTVIAVGATDQNDNRCSFSNYGDKLELMAPGKDILSVNMNGGYVHKSGTSMATPHVAGVAALVKSADPTLTNVEIREILKDTAKDLGNSGWDQYYGYGLVDAAAAVGGGGQNLPKVTVKIYKISNNPNQGNYEPIDSWIPPNNEVPEWYYRVGIKASGEEQYQHNYNKDVDGWWIFDWIGEYTWTAQQNHLFAVDDSTIDLSIKLMDHDALWEGGSDDLADISAAAGTGENNQLPDKAGAMYNGVYDLITDELTGDAVSNDQGYYLTKGQFGDDPANNADVWFKITDTYDPDDYEPELDVDPKTISCGEVKLGETVTKKFNVINKAETDPIGWADDLYWNIKSKPSFIKSISPQSGSLIGGESKEVTISVDTSVKGNFNGDIVVESNGGTKNIKISITVSKTRSRELIFYNLLQELLAKFPLLGNFLSPLF